MNDIQKAVLLSQIQPVQPGKASGSAQPKATGASFEAALQGSEVQFSKHAEKRLSARQIELGAEGMQKLSNAMSSLQQKGARDSLVLMGELAFVVNVPSKTVVTALSKEQMKEQVFTNIDSTILI